MKPAVFEHLKPRINKGPLQVLTTASIPGASRDVIPSLASPCVGRVKENMLITLDGGEKGLPLPTCRLHTPGGKNAGRGDKECDEAFQGARKV